MTLFPECPLPLDEYPRVLLAHGGGGRLTQNLIERVLLPSFDNPILAPLHDGALLDIDGRRLAFTTDSYVVQPPFFPGGDIGRLAVFGTANDLAMCGARPLFLSCGLIIEEGLPMEDLWRVVVSMKNAAAEAGVQIVTGDSKVVEHGKGDGVFIASRSSPGTARSSSTARATASSSTRPALASCFPDSTSVRSACCRAMRSFSAARSAATASL